MTEPAIEDATWPDGTNPVAALRAELDLTLAAMGERVGISKSQMHEVERTFRASLPVALKIETLSGGRIDAADLCEDVKAARHALLDSTAHAVTSAGKPGELSSEKGEAA